jgi:hypothetical protein
MTEPNETTLLIEGMKSYPKAVAALNDFVRLVISTIRDVVLEERENLSTAVGFEMKEQDLDDYPRPNEALLGVSINRIQKCGWGIYFYVWWSKTGPEFGISIYLRDPVVADSILTAFMKAGGPRVQSHDSHEMFVSRPLVPDKAAELPDSIRELTQAFGDLLIKAGGLGKFVKTGT